MKTFSVVAYDENLYTYLTKLYITSLYKQKKTNTYDQKSSHNWHKLYWNK